MVILIFIFSPNSEVGREKQNKIILFCYSLPTSDFGEKGLDLGLSGNLNHTYTFSCPKLLLGKYQLLLVCGNHIWSIEALKQSLCLSQMYLHI